MGTKEDYAEIRDVFLDALNAVENACEVFYDLAIDHKVVAHKAEDVGNALNENGSWIGMELYTLQDAQECLERLVGKAHQRAV